MIKSALVSALYLVLLVTQSSAIPDNLDTLVREFGEKHLIDGRLPQVAKTMAVKKRGKIHMHVELMGTAHEFLLEPVSAFSKDMKINVVKGKGKVENRGKPRQHSYHVVDERNADVAGTAIVHKNGYNKILTYTMGGAEYVLDGLGKGYDAGYSFFYAMKDIKVDPTLRDEMLLPPPAANGRRSVEPESQIVDTRTDTSALHIITEELPTVASDFGHDGHAGHMGGHLGRKRRAIQGLKVAELVVDLDVEYVSQFASVDEAIMGIADSVNAVNEFYLPAGIVHTIKSITVRTPEAPMYTGFDPKTLLDETFAAWQGSGEDDITMLFTGRKWSSPDITTIGLAYVGTVCWRDYNIGINQLLLERLPLDVQRIQLIAHEVGHSWGCSHVEAVPDNEPYVMYPSVQGRETSFGPTCMGILVGGQQSQTCLSMLADEEPCAFSPCVTGTCSVLHVGGKDNGVAKSVCTCPTGFSGELCEIEEDNCVNNACTSNAMGCVDGDNSYTCVCFSGFEGEFCEVNIDDCAGNPCGANGNCVDKLESYECQCNTGFDGEHCQNDINDCDPNPCANGGTCTDMGVEAFTCTCVAGFEGPDCSIQTNNCDATSCNGRGACSSGLNTYTCTCNIGFTGTDCETSVDDCAVNPCVNGQCTDGDNDYTCTCALGWEGKNCEQNINDCATNPCQQGAVCTDAVNDYSCACVGGFSGKNCEVAPSGCAVNPCAHGTCADAGTNGEYTCDCTGTGFEGTNCQTDIVDCVPNFCQNGGVCTEGVNSATCQCVAGFIGTNCEIDNCASVCLNGATCYGPADSVKCECAEGYEGANCATEKDMCASMPCANGGACTKLPNDYTCTCAAGFSGINCEDNINECDPNPCMNGANCIDEVNGYQCVCNPGFTGTNCETNINDCDHQQCQNGAVCIDGVDSFTCDCGLTGFRGEFCEQNIDDCINNPCGENGFKCHDGINTFTCDCNAGYTGATCLEDINECLTLNPCQNGATCTDKPNDYTCDCPVGYGGKDCEVMSDNCTPTSCANGGTCVNGLNSFTCACAEGYTGSVCSDLDLNQNAECIEGRRGDNCEIDINECREANPCVNGRCRNKKKYGTTYVCQCSQGWMGRNCDEAIPSTSPTQCIEGRRGDNCEIDINECLEANPCVNGRCRNKKRYGTTYVCRCRKGWTGRNCDEAA